MHRYDICSRRFPTVSRASAPRHEQGDATDATSKSQPPVTLLQITAEIGTYSSVTLSFYSTFPGYTSFYNEMTGILYRTVL